MFSQRLSRAVFRHVRFTVAPFISILCIATSTNNTASQPLSQASNSYYINSSVAKNIDAHLMGNGNFSIDQLMELAGLSVAQAINHYLKKQTGRRIYVICGPGNNGGDGLVAARHLSQFGYSVSVLYIPTPKISLYSKLLQQCKDNDIKVTTRLNLDDVENADVIVDAIFGFSFKGEPKEPYATVLQELKKNQNKVFSIDIPSGWVVDEPHEDNSWSPGAVISLTAPKICMKAYRGEHYLGGRFVSADLRNKFPILKGLPPYKGSDQFIKLDENIIVNEYQNDDWQLYLSPEGYPYYHNHWSGQSHWALQQKQKEVNDDGSELAVVLSTASSNEQAKLISKSLLSNKLCACVNLIPQVTSIYEWQGIVEESQEIVMIIKTRKHLVPQLTAKLKAEHSYEVPEVLALQVLKGIHGGNMDYINWVQSQTDDKNNEVEK